MSHDSRIALSQRPSLGPWVLLLFTVFSHGLLHNRLDAAAARLDSAPVSSTHTSPVSEGPAGLKKQIRITVETNAVPVAGATNKVAPQEKSFRWKADWEGWNGLHLGLTKQTDLRDPLADVREHFEGTNTFRVVHLEEMKMSGKIGGKLAIDAAGYATSKEFQDFDPGIELRRARVYAKGDCLLLLPVSYELEVGYIPNEFYIENSYLSLNNLPWIGELKVGQFQPPMSLALISSSRDLTYMEPAAAIQALAPGTSAGMEIGQPILDQRVTWRFGLFTDGVGKDYGDDSKDYGRAIMRLTGLPLWTTNQDGSSRLLHLGLSANVLYSGSSSVHYRSRPESHLAPYVVDTGDIAAEGSLVAAAEAAWVDGPLSVQGEYLHSWVKDNNGQTPQFQGFYASTSWFLTGECRPYDRTEGVFGRVIPKRNFNFGHGGWGAWEIAARVSYLDLDSGDIRGGRLAMLMGGINWYLHSHIKWRFDYGFGHVSDRIPDGNVNIFQTRIEVDF
jgi:phosphate-selective porin OprO and OprP